MVCQLLGAKSENMLQSLISVYIKADFRAFKAYCQPSNVESVAFGMHNCPEQFLSIPIRVTITGWKLFHAALFRPR